MKVNVPAALALVVLAAASGCAPYRIDDAYAPRREREELIGSLEELGIQDAEYARTWTQAVDSAWALPETITVPYEERSIFDPLLPGVRVFEVTFVERGRYRISLAPAGDGHFYLELYRRRGDEFELAATRAAEKPEITLELRREGDYRIVVQPEPLRGGAVRLTVERLGEEEDAGSQ